MADFVSDHDQLLGRVLVFGHVDEPRGAIERTEHALTDDAAGFVMAKFKIVVAESGGDECPGAPVALGSLQRFLVARPRLAANVDPGVHALALA